MIQHLEFRYEEGLYPSLFKQHALEQNINRWLQPFAEELNMERATVIIFFDKTSGYKIVFEKASDKLLERLNLHLQLLRTPGLEL